VVHHRFGALTEQACAGGLSLADRHISTARLTRQPRAACDVG
jgi:hypothetical protein